MPYDPALPADHSPLVAAEMRGQLLGLFEAFLAGRITNPSQIQAILNKIDEHINSARR